MATRQSLSGTAAPSVLDGANRAYSDSNPPQTFMRTQQAVASIVTPPAGLSDESTPDGKSLWMRAPDGTLTLIGPDNSGGALPGDHGYKLWTGDPYSLTTATVIPTAGTLYGSKLLQRNTQTISSVAVFVGTAGATLANVGFSLHTAAGALITSSVNANGATATAFQSTGTKVVTFTPVSISGPFYVDFWFTGTTLPALLRGTALPSMNAGLAAPNLRFFSANTGLTTAAPATLGAQATPGNAFWVAAN